MKKILYNQFHEKLKTLKEIAQQAIREARQEKSYNEGLCCHLAETISQLEETTAELSKTIHEDDEIIHDVQLIKNLIEQPIVSRSNPHKKVSLLQAATSQNQSKDNSEIKEVILACVLDEPRSEMMIKNIEQICYSIEDQIAEIEEAS